METVAAFAPYVRQAALAIIAGAAAAGIVVWAAYPSGPIMTELPLGGIPEERSRETPAVLICGVFSYIEGDGVYSSLDTLSGPQLGAQAAALIEELRRRGQYRFAMAHPADDSDLPAEITAAVASLGYPLSNFDVVQASGLRAQLISRDVMTRRRTDRREIFAAGLELLITPRRGQPEELLIGQRGMVYICEP